MPNQFVSQPTRSWRESSIVRWLCFGIIIGSTALFLYRGIIRHSSAIHSDFNCFYTAGQLWNEGANPYDYNTYRARRIALAGAEPVTDNYGLLYPPPAVAFFGLFARLPIQPAYIVFMVFNVGLALACLWMMRTILRWFISVGWFEWAFLASLLNTSFAFANVRQVGLIACTIILASFIVLKHQRLGWAGGLLGLLVFKPTFLPMYLAGYTVRRQWRLVLACGAAGCILMLAPIVLAGRPPVETMQNWLTVAKTNQAPGDANDPSPFVNGSIRMLHLAPLAYRVLNSQSEMAIMVVWAMLAAIVGYAFLLMLIGNPYEDASLIDFGLMSVLSLLVIYHRHYDIFLLFPGLLAIYIHTRRLTDKVQQRRWSLFLLALVLCLCVPINRIDEWSVFYPALQDNYLWRVVAPLHSWATIGVVGALLWLKTEQIGVRSLRFWSRKPSQPSLNQSETAH